MWHISLVLWPNGIKIRLFSNQEFTFQLPLLISASALEEGHGQGRRQLIQAQFCWAELSPAHLGSQCLHGWRPGRLEMGPARKQPALLPAGCSSLHHIWKELNSPEGWCQTYFPPLPSLTVCALKTHFYQPQTFPSKWSDLQAVCCPDLSFDFW